MADINKQDIARDHNLGRKTTKCCRYHKNFPPKIFDESESEELAKEGWTDHPNKVEEAYEKVMADKEKDPPPPPSDPEPEIPPDPVEVAYSLAKGEGLNHASWMRKMGCDPNRDRKKTKDEYKEIFAALARSVTLYQQQNDWFIKKEA